MELKKSWYSVLTDDSPKNVTFTLPDEKICSTCHMFSLKTDESCHSYIDTQDFYKYYITCEHARTCERTSEPL